MRLEELYAFQIKRIARDTGDVLERFIKIGKATKPQMRLAKTRKDHTPIGNVDYFVDVDLIWQSSNQGLFWDEKLTLKMERALRNKCFKKFIPYVGEGIHNTTSRAIAHELRRGLRANRITHTRNLLISEEDHVCGECNPTRAPRDLLRNDAF